jgi:hypothetical protein
MIKDPFGSLQAMLGRFRNFMGNPMQFLAQNRLNIPPNVGNDPQSIMQYLMNSGQLSQEQYNWAASMAKQIENNPQFMQMFGNNNRR